MLLSTQMGSSESESKRISTQMGRPEPKLPIESVSDFDGCNGARLRGSPVCSDENLRHSLTALLLPQPQRLHSRNYVY
jgi:hypothetical protein